VKKHHRLMNMLEDLTHCNVIEKIVRKWQLAQCANMHLQVECFGNTMHISIGFDAMRFAPQELNLSKRRAIPAANVENPPPGVSPSLGNVVMRRIVNTLAPPHKA
jgi:hypothetical protein